MRKKNTHSILLSSLTILTILTLLTILLILSGIPKTKWSPENSMEPVLSPNIYDSGDLRLLKTAIENSMRYFSKTSKNNFIFGENIYTKQDMTDTLKDFSVHLEREGLNDSFYSFVKNNFDFFESSESDALFTGYFESQLQGSLVKTGEYIHPLYIVPDDLVSIELIMFDRLKSFTGLPSRITGRLTREKRIVPYFSRMEIDTLGKLTGKNLELAWVKDRISLFFLHIQGSGILKFQDGNLQHVNYAGSNGHPYRAIGRYLINKKICTLDELSMQFIDKYLRNNPQKMEEIFNYNPSYVFFRKVPEGPIGSLGVPVTSFRSIATDRRLFPYGALCYIETKIPVFDSDGKIRRFKNFRRFVLNQDTGGAIVSPGRVDLFCGHGRDSELIAGHLRSRGKLYFLIRKDL